ncbi:MAG: hypothetical protein QJT80_12000 [Candidatus Thiocaldithrix dubininis]|uniref:Lactoylglutathione lyase n=1 Tax=Candidatus Thiocaldithrix dubininis TaxID=3080823 RepID=A0AA95H3I4_9GAMM|nr:MAG: hypothetical protein QJT80_12000 [Candidatus Thiocaldithrix dubininis]
MRKGSANADALSLPALKDGVSRARLMNAGTTIIAFLEDPDGYQIELIGAKH